MACTISSGIPTSACRDNRGGLKTMWIANFDDVETVDNIDSLVSGITMADTGKTFHEFRFNPDSSSFSSAPEVDIANGTAQWNHTITTVFGKVNSSQINLFKVLVAGNFVAICQDRNGKYFLFGKGSTGDNGVYVTGGDGIQSGTVGTDLNGTGLEITGNSVVPPPEVVESVVLSVIS